MDMKGLLHTEYMKTHNHIVSDTIFGQQISDVYKQTLGEDRFNMEDTDENLTIYGHLV